MRIRTKIIAVVGAALFGAYAVCGVYAVSRYRKSSVEKLAAVEMEKLELAEQVFSQIGTREEFDRMGEVARDAYLKYQFERCYRKGYALLKGNNCIQNMTDYEIQAPEALEEVYTIQKLGETYLLIMKKDLSFLQGFCVMSVKDITSTWEEGRRQAKEYLCVFLAAFTVSMAAVSVIIGHILKALEKLQAQAERIKAGDFQGKVALTSRDELKELSDSINDMSDKIQQQIEDLELLLGAMAHEMKTPLTNIIGYVDSLLHVRLNDRQKEQSLEAVCRSAGRLNEMSGKLLQLIGLYGSQEMERRDVELSQVLMDVYEENREKLEEKNIHFQMSQNENMMIQGDRMLLTSLFGNLVSNSIKALDDSGEIRVTVDLAERAVSVEDNGRGIPQEDLAHVTKAFYMVDKSRSRRQQGSGLGLALAEKIARAHNAEMRIESRLGKGTKVTVRFTN